MLSSHAGSWSPAFFSSRPSSKRKRRYTHKFRQRPSCFQAEHSAHHQGPQGVLIRAKANPISPPPKITPQRAWTPTGKKVVSTNRFESVGGFRYPTQPERHPKAQHCCAHMSSSFSYFETRGSAIRYPFTGGVDRPAVPSRHGNKLSYCCRLLQQLTRVT